MWERYRGTPELYTIGRIPDITRCGAGANQDGAVHGAPIVPTMMVEIKVVHKRARYVRESTHTLKSPSTSVMLNLVQLLCGQCHYPQVGDNGGGMDDEY